MYERTYGSKYDQASGLGVAGIAKLIRADVKAARKDASTVIGQAPECIKFGITSESFAGGRAVNIHIKGIPQDWGWETREDRYGYMTEMATDALQALAKALRAIMDSYNHDGSETQVDYWDVSFYGSVYNEGGRVLA